VLGNCSEISAEIVEVEYPVLAVDKEFMIDTAGPGRFRGGPGITYTNRCEADAEMSLSCDRMRTSAWGVFGGGSALPQALYEVLDDDAPFELGWSPVDNLRMISGRHDADGRADSEGDGWKTCKFSHRRTEAGITVRIINSGGGGYGDPLDRETWRVADDVRNELVSHEAARAQYGVVVGGDFTVDEQATERLRAERRAEPPEQRAARLKHTGWRDREWFSGDAA
jgi:N-methylhydantoinase B